MASSATQKFISLVAFLVVGTVFKLVKSAVTDALSCSISPTAVRPNPLTTAPVPFRKKARPSRAAFSFRIIGRLSASGSATVV
jgi:hypothetical protein